MWVLASTTKEFAVRHETTVRRAIVVAASPRTGSHLLCGALQGSGVGGEPRGYLNVASYPDLLDGTGWLDLDLRGIVGRVARRVRGDADWRRVHQHRLNGRAAAQLLHGVAARRTAPDGVFSIKLMWDHYEFMLRRGTDASFGGAPVSWVFVRREDRLRQAVSWCRAEQTGQWRSTSPVRGELAYDRVAIERKIERGDHDEAQWRAYFAERGIEPFEVTYEQLDHAYEATVSAMFEHLGLVGARVVPRTIERQSDQLNDEWVERFRSDTAASGRGVLS